MDLDTTLDAILEKQQRRQCKTCKLVEAGLVTDVWLVDAVARGGAPNVSKALTQHFSSEAPGSDAIRNHLAQHVA